MPLILFGYEKRCYLKMCLQNSTWRINHINQQHFTNDQWTMDTFNVNFWTAKKEMNTNLR